MRIRKPLLLAVVGLVFLTSMLAGAAPSYRSFVEWNGPYYHVRHGLNTDSSAYLSYLVNNPLPLYSSPFSSPTAVVLYGSPVSLTAFVVDHDHHRVQTFATNANWTVEALSYSATPVQGNFGGRFIKFTVGETIPGSEHILVNGHPFTRVDVVTGYTTLDSVYSIVYSGVPNTGGVASLPNGWSLGQYDSVQVEYGFATPPGTPGVGEIDYTLFQAAPTDIPLQLHEATSPDDPPMSDLSSLAINASVRPGKTLDLYLVNALSGGMGTLSSYDLTNIGPSGVYGYVDTYPGLMGRPYDVEIVDNGNNTAGTVVEGIPSGADNTNLIENITNQNTYLGHNYRITYAFDTSSTMNQVDAPDNQESDLYFDQRTGRLHMVFCADDAVLGTAYSYSDDYGQTWSAAQTISPNTLTAAHDRPHIVVRTTGEIHVVYEAINGAGERQLYHTFSSDGSAWSPTTELTSALTPGIVSENRYANLLLDPTTDNLHLIWAGDDKVYHRIFSASWGGITQVATGTGVGYSAPSAVIDAVGRIYMAYVSDAASPSSISYMLFNGAVWGSFHGGGFTAGTPDPVTTSSGVTAASGTREELFPFPQIALTGDSIWVFWVGTGTENYTVSPVDMSYNMIPAIDGDFTVGAGTPITTGDNCTPTRFAVSVDAGHNIHIAYEYGSVPDQEGLRYKTWTNSTNNWFPATTTTGRTIFNEGAAATVWAYEPRLITPTIGGQIAPMLSLAKAYTALGGGSPRIVFKVIDGVLSITDQTTLSEYNQWRVWSNGGDDEEAIPGMTLTIWNTDISVSNTDQVDATEFNVGDYFELQGTPPVKNDLLFVSDTDNHRVKVIRAYDNIDNCFGGAQRWDIPGQSDGTPSQTYKLATVGGEGTFRVWASSDSAAWTVVSNLLIAGPADRVCEVNRYTREIRFGDGSHGLIPTAGTYIRVSYVESVDEAEFGRLGSGAGQMSYPRGLAADYNTAHGLYDVYTCDTGNNRLQKWAYAPNPFVDPALWTSAVCSWNTGRSDSDFVSAPEDIETVTLNGQVYLVVSDAGKKRVLIYRDNEATGTGGVAAPVFVSEIGSAGTSLNQFLNPRGLAAIAEDSGLVVFAADADRDEVAKIVQRDWLTTVVQDTTGGGTTQTNILTVGLTDGLDGDNYLLMQPGAVRTIQLKVARCDSLVGLRAVATFPPSVVKVLSVSEGNLWSGENYTNKVFLYSINNALGRIEVNSTMVGDDNGLTSTGARVIASIVVTTDSAAAVPSSGTITLSDSTDLRKSNNRRITTYQRNNMAVRVGYLADIASTAGAPGTPPSMVPQPDGKIDFADVNVFTQGWNGNGLISDPIADIGPYVGSTVPRLVANPDTREDAYDLLSLSTMYNWYYATGRPIVKPPVPPTGTKGRSTLDAVSEPVAMAARRTTNGWTLELQAREVAAVTTAHLYLEIHSPGSAVTGARAGDFLGSDNTLFLDAVRDNVVDISLGRLNRESPSASGSGVLAYVDLSAVGETPPDVYMIYELRDSRNTIIASSEISKAAVQEIPSKFSLSDPYPNPFNATTMFTLNLNEAGHASLKVFNMLGQEVVTILDQDLPAGVHNISWTARNSSGAALSSGLYFAQFKANGRSDLKKIVLLR